MIKKYKVIVYIIFILVSDYFTLPKAREEQLLTKFTNIIKTNLTTAAPSLVENHYIYSKTYFLFDTLVGASVAAIFVFLYFLPKHKTLRQYYKFKVTLINVDNFYAIMNLIFKRKCTKTIKF